MRGGTTDLEVVSTFLGYRMDVPRDGPNDRPLPATIIDWAHHLVQHANNPDTILLGLAIAYLYEGISPRSQPTFVYGLHRAAQQLGDEDPNLLSLLNCLHLDDYLSVGLNGSAQFSTLGQLFSTSLPARREEMLQKVSEDSLSARFVAAEDSSGRPQKDWSGTEFQTALFSAYMDRFTGEEVLSMLRGNQFTSDVLKIGTIVDYLLSRCEETDSIESVREGFSILSRVKGVNDAGSERWAEYVKNADITGWESHQWVDLCLEARTLSHTKTNHAKSIWKGSPRLAFEKIFLEAPISDLIAFLDDNANLPLADTGEVHQHLRTSFDSLSDVASLLQKRALKSARSLRVKLPYTQRDC